VRARGIGVLGGVDYESSGLVEKLHIDIIKNTLDQGLIPIFPNIGWNAKGKPYNISSDELAFALSCQLKAAKLFFITSATGISAKKFVVPEGVNVNDDGIINQLTVDEAGEFLELNAQKKYNEIIEMVTLGYRACREGVQRVHFVDGRVEGMVLKEIFTNRGLGTMIYGNHFENVRAMEYNDIPEVLRIMQPSIEAEILIPRTAADLEQKKDDYVVYEVDDTVHGCGALHVFDDDKAEIAGIAVDETSENRSIGKKIVTYLIDKATRLKLREVFVLTTQTADWFLQLGFAEGSVEDLPEEKKKKYNTSRKSRVLLYRLAKPRSKRRLGVE
jgi:amino-acid N-acetyltransferase